MSPLDLIRSRDGSMSLTKLAATTGHFLFAVAFAKLAWFGQFNADLWLIYGGYVFGHHVIDKAGAQVKAFKDKQLEK